MKAISHDDIKPFTQLPHVKTDDYTKIIDGMDKKKLEESFKDGKVKDFNDETFTKMTSVGISKMRRSSLESGEIPTKDEYLLKRQKSLDDRGKSSEREESEEKDKSDSDRRTERRIRNKVLLLFKYNLRSLSSDELLQPSDNANARSLCRYLIPPSLFLRLLWGRL